MAHIDYYELLGISQDALPDEIKRSYKTMVMMYHPDKVSNLGYKLRNLALEEMKKLNTAKDLLLDDTKRRKYDITLRGIQREAKKNVKDDGCLNKYNETLQRARKYIDDLRNMKADVREAENFFIQAKYAFKKNDVPRAAELADHSKKVAKSILYKYAVDVILLSKERLIKHKKSGIDITIAIEMLSQSKELIRKGSYLEAVELAVDAVRTANDIAKEMNKFTMITSNAHIPSASDIFEDISFEIHEGHVAEWSEASREEDLQLYKDALEKVWADGILTIDEKKELTELRETLGINMAEHKELESKVLDYRSENMKIYLNALMVVLKDGVIDDDERRMLYDLRERLKLEKDDVFLI